jgi:RNA-binding protein YhbY
MELQDIIHRKANVIIGKSGLSQGKILKSALSADYSKEKLIEDLIAKTNLHKIDQRGYSVILSNLPKK